MDLLFRKLSMKKEFSCFKYNIEGGAIMFSLIILLMSAIFISLFITLDLGYLNLNRKHSNFRKAQNKITEGFKLGSYISTTSFKGIKAEGLEGLTLDKSLWGSYFLVSAMVNIDSTNSIKKIGLIGNEIKNDYSMYLADNGSKLSLTGNTSISGNVFLPEKGVSISYVEGKTYIGKELIYGDMLKSKSTLPSINNYFVQNNLSMIKGKFNSKTDSVIKIENLLETNITNSFANKTVVLFAKENIILDGSWQLKGNILLYSNENIIISSYAKLENILVCSKNITVLENSSFSGQLIVSKKLVVDSNVNLHYPSSIVALGDSSYVEFQGNSTFSGSLISLKTNYSANNTVRLSKNSKINGIIYCDGKVESKGEINGKLICSKLFYKSPSTEYTNTLIDAKISNNLPFFYSVSPIMKTDNPNTQVIKWLN